MTRYATRSLGLFVTVLMLTLSVGCGEDLGDTGVQSAELSKGECNAIVARALSAAQRCARGDCGFEECVEVGEAFQGFFGNEDCAAGFAAGDINGLPENASIHPQTGAIKHVGEVICGSVVFCGFCEGAPEGVCTGPCEEAEKRPGSRSATDPRTPGRFWLGVRYCRAGPGSAARVRFDFRL